MFSGKKLIFQGISVVDADGGSGRIGGPTHPRSTCCRSLLRWSPWRSGNQAVPDFSPVSGLTSPVRGYHRRNADHPHPLTRKAGCAETHRSCVLGGLVADVRAIPCAYRNGSCLCYVAGPRLPSGSLILTFLSAIAYAVGLRFARSVTPRMFLRGNGRSVVRKRECKRQDKARMG